MNELITVIVPVYNVEIYLDKCIESIVNQTYKNLEIILVDDGSSDSSPQICDKWADKDSRITVIHKENGGVSSARNAALNIAKGDYISFVDSDDYIESNMYETLLSLALKNDADISRCSYRYEYNDNSSLNETTVDYSKVSECVINVKEYMSNWYQAGLSYSACWNKLYKKELISDVKFNPEYKIGEDHLFTYQAVKKSKTISELPMPFYVYCIHNESAMNSGNNLKNRLDNIEVHRQIYLQEKDNADVSLSFAQMYCLALTDTFAYSVKNKLNTDDDFVQILSYIKSDYNDLIKAPLGRKEKAKLFLIRKFRFLYTILLKLYYTK